MSYRLEFNEHALKEWHKLDNSIRAQFKKQLERRLIEPHVPSARLSGHCSKFFGTNTITPPVHDKLTNLP